MLLETSTSEKKRPPPVPRDIPGTAPLVSCERPDAKERLGSERDDVIVAGKRQWPDAGIFLGTGGGLFFLTWLFYGDGVFLARDRARSVKSYMPVGLPVCVSVSVYDAICANMHFCCPPSILGDASSSPALAHQNGPLSECSFGAALDRKSYLTKKWKKIK
jgi:hypothetical protein